MSAADCPLRPSLILVSPLRQEVQEVRVPLAAAGAESIMRDGKFVGFSKFKHCAEKAL
jgi:hypothetical protein